MKLNPSKHIQKYRTEEESREALYALCDGKAQRSIPPQVDDADIVLSDCLTELWELRKFREDVCATAQGWVALATRR